MEIESLRSAWQNRSLAGGPFPASAGSSRSLQYIRASAICDLQRSDDLSRFIFCLLFALVAIGVSFAVIPPGAARIAAWLLALALVIDGIASLVLLARRFREPATSTMLEFIRREHCQVETRLRFDRFSQWLMITLAVVVLVVLLFTPGPANLRENALDTLQRMAIVTVFLAVAWRRAKSPSRATCRELERYLNDLSQ